MSVIEYKIDKLVSKGFYVKNTKHLDKLKFSVSFQFKVSVEETAVCCISHYEYKFGEEDVMLFDLECYFKIQQDYLHSLIKEGVLTIDADILQYLATIAVGAARGEIHARCEKEGSPIQSIVLPPVNLTEIITTPAVFNFE